MPAKLVYWTWGMHSWYPGLVHAGLLVYLQDFVAGTKDTVLMGFASISDRHHVDCRVVGKLDVINSTRQGEPAISCTFKSKCFVGSGKEKIIIFWVKGWRGNEKEKTENGIWNFVSAKVSRFSSCPKFSTTKKSFCVNNGAWIQWWATNG